jgi:hypothetical protein
MKPKATASKLPIAGIATRTACAVCMALKEFQNNLLLKRLSPNECRRFCNSHGWMVANSTPAESAVTIFLAAIANPDWQPAAPVGEECDVCRKMHEEKERRLSEVVEQLRDLKIHSWFHDNAMLCSRHGREVMAKLPENVREDVQELLARNGGEIVGLLEDYLERLQSGAHAGGGVLGRAAEFLLAQRGIET